MGITGSGKRDDELAHAYVERLEAALAAAAHERDLAEERARLAGEGVERLEERVAALRRQRDREHDEAERALERHAAEAQRERERDLAEAQERLEAREKHLANAKSGIEARDRRLELAAEKLEARDEELSARREELKELGAASAAQRTEAAVIEARLELREEELKRSQATAHETREELRAMRERLEESERKLAVSERDLAARVRELGQAGEELVAREGELEAAGTLLETQGAELARGRENAAAAARERDEVRARLEAREKHLANAKAGIEARDRRLEVAARAGKGREAELASRDAELRRLRAAEPGRERKLALAEARLEKAQQRAEYFQSSLVEIRSGRAYRLMRILWRLRRPFRRAPRDGGDAPTDVPVGDDSEPAPPPPSPAAIAEREPASRSRGERLRVASVLDEMSAACFAPECDLVPLSLDGWREQLDERRPDLLLVESAWNGNGGEWQYRIAQYPRKDLAGLPALRELLDGCRERGIPTAFWNKEDPVHFERFAEAAALFDHVFTTDAHCVERYRALPGGARTVTPLPFAAQPRIHNPVAAVAERSASPCFAGAWYADRHPERRRSLEELLDAARPYGLVIYDRRFGAEDAAFGFPERFAPHILGKLPYERILDVYKGHRVFLNANSVVDSPTMCSRRVFELAACDTAIVSTPGAALSSLLGEGMVEEAGDEASAAAALERLLGDEPERRRRTRAARRAVFAEHTYADRLATIAAAAGLDAPRGDEWELVVQPGVELSAEARADLRAASVFASADAIGVGMANGGPAPEHRHVAALDPRALLLRRELVESRGCPAGSAEQVRARLREWSDEGVRLYAADADLLAT